MASKAHAWRKQVFPIGSPFISWLTNSRASPPWATAAMQIGRFLFISSGTNFNASPFCCCWKPFAELVLLASLAQKGREEVGGVGRHGVPITSCLTPLNR